MILPVYVECEDNDCIAGWLERHDRHIPLKRVVDDLEPVVLPGSPTTGAAGGHARAIAERLEDVRVAAAILAGAALKAEVAIDATPHIAFVPLAAQRAWVRPLIAAREPLRLIIEACAAFEDALAPELDEHSVCAAAVHASIAAVEAVRAAMPDAKTQATIELVSKTHATVRQYADAAESSGFGGGLFPCLTGDIKREKQ